MTIKKPHNLTPDKFLDAEEEAALLESEYMSYLESGGTGEREPMSFEEWRKKQ